MRSVRMIEAFYECDIKPSELLERYIELTKRDVRNLLVTADGAEDSPCPGCHGTKIASSFERFGMSYVECADCHTLRVNPRPSDNAIANYYRNAEAEQFWREELSKVTREARHKNIIAPHMEWIIDSAQQYLPGAEHIADVRTHQDGYATALAGLERFSRKTMLSPITRETAIGLNVVEDELADGSVDVVSMFEVLDRTADVDELMAGIHRVLAPGGLCFLTDILASGFDIQVLWENAANIFPPDRINLFSVEGLRELLERHGFEVLEFSTPGIFDAAIVANAIRKNPDMPVSRVISYMFNNRSDDELNRFQTFLQTSLMSSYARVLVRKP